MPVTQIHHSDRFNRRRRAIWVVPALAAAITAGNLTGTVQADWGSMVHKIKIGYFRNVAWPDPFNEADAMQVVMPFEVMKNNGWRTHNTIGAELFRAGDGALLASGQQRVRWIATQSPEARRTIHVFQAKTQEETDRRVASVREAVDAIVPSGRSPQILVTNIKPATTPGAFATKINRERLEQMPAPILPSTTASGQEGATSQ